MHLVSDENEKKGSHQESILNNTISNRNILFKCTEEARLLTGFQVCILLLFSVAY